MARKPIVSRQKIDRRMGLPESKLAQSSSDYEEVNTPLNDPLCHKPVMFHP